MSKQESRKRSLVKALSYRAIIVCLDFLAVYLLTGTFKAAAGFAIVSNIYTTIGYFLHERAWTHITWGTVTRDAPTSGCASGAGGISAA